MALCQARWAARMHLCVTLTPWRLGWRAQLAGEALAQVTVPAQRALSLLQLRVQHSVLPAAPELGICRTHRVQGTAARGAHHNFNWRNLKVESEVVQRDGVQLQ